MLRWIALGMLAGTLCACNSFTFYTSSNKAINGNSTGGIVPATVTDENDQVRDATAHCQQYNKQLRVTARPQDTGGKLIFVCEAPGTPLPPAAAPPPSDQGDLPPGVRMKKK